MSDRLFPREEDSNLVIHEKEKLCPKCGLVLPATGVCDDDL